MAKIKVMLYGDASRKDGSYTVYLRIHKNGKRKFISLGFSVQEKDWDASNATVRAANPNHKRLNNLIAKKYSEVMNAAIDLETRDYKVSIGQITAKVFGSSGDYFKFSKSYIERFNNEDQQGTYVSHKSAINVLKKYLGKDVLSFYEITPTFLREYEMHLKKNGKMVNTIWCHLKRIRSIYRAAVIENQADESNNPFKVVKLTLEKTKKESLTIDELRKIINTKPPVWNMMWHAKNVFLLQFYIRGVRVSDILTMEEAHVVGGRYSKQARKTKHNVSVELPPEAKAIVETYRKEKAKRNVIHPYVLPLVKDGDATLHKRIGAALARVNKELKVLMETCGIEKNISSHCARHTYASIAKARIKDIHILMELFDHSSLAITQSYLADLDSAQLDEANKIVTTL